MANKAKLNSIFIFYLKMLKKINPTSSNKINIMMIKDFFARRNFTKVKLANTSFISIDLNKLSFVDDEEQNNKHTFKVMIALKHKVT